MKKTLLILISLSLTLNAQLTRSNEIVIDSETGLMWQDNEAVLNTQKTWSQAKQYCKNLQHAGFSDWYLPSVKELLTITDKSSYKPSLAHAFTNRSSSAFWSSSANVSYSNSAWRVTFKYGYSYTTALSPITTMFVV